jgi:hypothetical protein
MAVEQSVNQVQIARAATSRAHRQASGCGGFRASCEGRYFFVARMHPANRAQPVETVGESVEAVAGDAPDVQHASGGEGLCQMIGDGSGHNVFLVQESDRARSTVRAYQAVASTRRASRAIASSTMRPSTVPAPSRAASTTRCAHAIRSADGVSVVLIDWMCDG